MCPFVVRAPVWGLVALLASCATSGAASAPLLPLGCPPTEALDQINDLPSDPVLRTEALVERGTALEPSNYCDAASLFKKAAESGSPRALYHLARMRLGHDAGGARVLMERAAAAGDYLAQKKLGELYASGQNGGAFGFFGIPKSERLSQKWREAAATTLAEARQRCRSRPAVYAMARLTIEWERKLYGDGLRGATALSDLAAVDATATDVESLRGPIECRVACEP